MYTLGRTTLKTLFLALLVTLNACQDADISKISHDADQFVSAKAKNHQAYTRSEFYNKVLKSRGVRAIPEADILNEASQYWLDILDTVARERQPEQLQGVPKPKAIVVYNKALNAYVSGGFLCADVGPFKCDDGRKCWRCIFRFFQPFKQGQGSVVKWPGNPDCLKVLLNLRKSQKL